MPEINNETLIISIQAIAREIYLLQKAITNNEAEPEEYRLLEERLRAAQNLKKAYEKLSTTILNLPPYNKLTHQF